MLQKEVRRNPTATYVNQNEREAVKKYANLRRHEESFLHQKAKVHWLEVGDANTSFFHNSIKERRARNKIYSITSSNGEKLEFDSAIAAECGNYFEKMFVTPHSDPYEPSIIANMELSNSISEEDSQMLIRPISRDEISYDLQTPSH
ncbi:hypothetical protein BVC80_1571g6 [Macleaya cordata]|uniref:Uncharacterized protein n=1 Tax=Macleaya cordata TaxID=56857 RepID=A0A200QPB3_MACCD|nr:hypothetical protein BVC80_1571g5 [Macleaya cordata]OVA12304.1 hypothetical protein BVC80_1571g6 [Macleaya cordata]